MQNYRRELSEREYSPLLSLLFLSVCFFFGIILGHGLSKLITVETTRQLNQYLLDYVSLELDSDIHIRMIVSSLVVYLRYPLLVFLLGFSSIGTGMIPLLTLVCGAFLSFSVSCLSAAFENSGIILALVIFGFRSLISLPCYFLIAVPAWRMSIKRTNFFSGRSYRHVAASYGRSHWICCGVCSTVLVIASFLEVIVGPQLLEYVLMCFG